MNKNKDSLDVMRVAQCWETEDFSVINYRHFSFLKSLCGLSLLFTEISESMNGKHVECKGYIERIQ